MLRATYVLEFRAYITSVHTSAPPPAQAFIAVLLLVSWMEPPPAMSATAYDCVELFAGKGRIARLARSRGWHSVCHDIAYDREAGPDQRNAMDINGSAGFA